MICTVLLATRVIPVIPVIAVIAAATTTTTTIIIIATFLRRYSPKFPWSYTPSITEQVGFLRHGLDADQIRKNNDVQQYMNIHHFEELMRIFREEKREDSSGFDVDKVIIPFL